MLAALASPCRIKRNHRRRRRIVSGRRHYNYFRDYDPTTGRYAESDPIGLNGGISTYGYALNSPLYYSDPTGRDPGAVLGGEIGTFIEPGFGTVVGAAIGFGLGAAAIWWAANHSSDNPSNASAIPTTVTGPTCPPKPPKDPCKGLADQLAEHQQKLNDYMSDPLAHDNKNFLPGASPDLQAKIYQSRVMSLVGQIRTFERDLAQCRANNGG
jgi:RHS repeat-associated protein